MDNFLSESASPFDLNQVIPIGSSLIIPEIYGTNQKGAALDQILNIYEQQGYLQLPTSSEIAAEGNFQKQTLASNTNRDPLTGLEINQMLLGDADSDGDTDKNDITLILNQRNQTLVGSYDPRDFDRNGIISILDSRKLGLAIAANTDKDAPIISATLLNDTAPNGTTNTDGITYDASIGGKVADASQVTGFWAGFNNTPVENFVNILDTLEADGSFSLNLVQLAQIDGGSLTDGAYTLHLQAKDRWGNLSSVFDISFTLDRITDFNARSLAKVLQNEGATATEIAQIFNYRLGLTLETIANGLDDGTTFGYTDIAKALWNSGKIDFNSQDLARVLQNEGATAIEIAQAFNYGLGFSLEIVANALDDGATFNYTTIAEALWNSGKTDFNSLDLARVLQNEGATATEIAQAFNYAIGRTVEGIAFDLDEGTTFNYTEIAQGLWNSGKVLNAPTLARVLQNEGATAIEVAQSLYFSNNGTLEQIADGLDDGATFSYTEIAQGLSLLPIPFNSLNVARVLQNEGATATEIAQAFNYGYDFNLEQIAHALDEGTSFSYTEIAYALWNSGIKVYFDRNFDGKSLAFILEQEGATATQIAQALHYGIGVRNATVLANLLDTGTSTSYADMAAALRDSGLPLSSRDIAQAIQSADLARLDGGTVTATNIAQALRVGLGLNLETIADALDEGTTFDYTSIAKGLWNSGYALNSRILAQLLQNEGASETGIAQALNYGLGLNLTVIADALDDGATFNYTNIAKGLWNSGKAIDSKQLADLLQSEGATATQIAQALNYGIDGRTLEGIAFDLNEGTTFNYISIAEALWNSGKSLDSRDLARVLQNERADAITIAQALNYGVNASLEQIADALDDGATFSYTDIAKGLWNSGLGLSDYRLSRLLRDEGADFWTTVRAVDAAATSYERALFVTVQGDIKDVINYVADQAQSVVASLSNFYNDNKEVFLILDPVGVVAREVGTKVIDSVLKGDFEVVTDPNKIVELGQELIKEGLSPIVDGSPLTSQLLERLEDSIDPLPLTSTYMGDAAKFINDKFKELEPQRQEVHELLDAAGTPQTIATNTVLYTLEGDFKNAWKSFKKDPAINDLIDSVSYAIRGDIRNADESIRSFLRAGGIEVQGIPEESINKTTAKKLKEEAYKAFADASGISLKTIKAAAGEPGYTTDDQMHAIFSILAYYNIPYVSAGALAINTGYYIAEASKQFDLKNDTEGLKRLLTAAGSAAKLQNAYDWFNAVLALRDVDFDNLSAPKSIGAYKEVLGSVLEAIDVEDGKEWVFGAFDLADGEYFKALGNVAIALTDIEDKNDQENMRKWANALNVLIEKEGDLSSKNYKPIIQEIFTRLEITNVNRINAVFAKGNNEEALKEAILLAVEELDISEVSFEDAKALVDLVFEIRKSIKTKDFSPVLEKAFSYVGIDDNGVTQIVDALTSLKDGDYEEVLKGVLNAADITGAAGLIEAGKILKDGIDRGTINYNLKFEEGEKKALIQILKALGAKDAETRADKAEKQFQ